MKLKFHTLTLSILFPFSLLCQNNSVESIFSKIDDLVHKVEYNDAYLLLKNSIDQYPRKWFEFSKEIIYLNKKMGKYEQNLEVFKEAHQRGYFYFIHPRMKEYKPYLKYPAFDSISNRDLTLLNEANKNSSTIYEIKLPDSLTSNKNYPVIFIFHGGGKSMEDVKVHWTGKELSNHYIRVYLQSYRHFDSKSYGWRTSDDRLDKEIRGIYDEIKMKYNIDETNIFACGISAGASAAIDISLRLILPARGVLALCPGMPNIIRNEEFDLIKNKDLSIYMVAGENDHFLERQKQMTQSFEKLNIIYKHEIIKGMGHQYPENEEKYFKVLINNLKF